MQRLIMLGCVGFLLVIFAESGYAQPAITATVVGSDHINITFTSTFVPVAWRVCVKQGRLNPRPNCWAGELDTVVQNPSPTSQTGSYSITGLHRNRWYTIVVREQKPGHIWMDKLGKLQVKTNK